MYAYIHMYVAHYAVTIEITYRKSKPLRQKLLDAPFKAAYTTCFSTNVIFIKHAHFKPTQYIIWTNYAEQSMETRSIEILLLNPFIAKFIFSIHFKIKMTKSNSIYTVLNCNQKKKLRHTRDALLYNELPSSGSMKKFGMLRTPRKASFPMELTPLLDIPPSLRITRNITRYSPIKKNPLSHDCTEYLRKFRWSYRSL